jgi:hypothetical protein
MLLIDKVEEYLKDRFGPDTRLKQMKPLGEGLHGKGYLLESEAGHEKRRIVMKGLNPVNFGHDHFADRAQVLILASANYNLMENHIAALDVVGETPEGLVSIGKAREFYIFMEEAKGESYFQDLDAVLTRKSLTDDDRERAQSLAHFLVNLHDLKYQGNNARSLYRRRIRDLIGHGECILGVIDAYDQVAFAKERELIDYAIGCLSWWGKIRERKERLCRVHGDFHPGNIWFKEDHFVLLDRSRGSWGEPADDVSCLGVNYVYYAIKDTGKFEGPFADLFRLFIQAYLEKTRDALFFSVAQPFFAFRALVLANPDFYPNDRDETKRKLFNFGRSILETERIEIDRISDYLEQ